MNILKQSTAATIKLGPFIDDTDGKTAETGLTIAQADVRLSKNGGDFAQTNNTAGATHDENGYYDIPLNATDTGTLGRLRVAVNKSGALPVWQDFQVVTANVYDTLCSTDSLDVNVTSLADDVITAAKFDESTAFPLKSADTGLTQVARVGADGDTLETLSDEIAAVKTDTAAILEDTGTTLDGLIKDVPTVAEFNARTKPAADYFDPATDTVANVTAVGTTTNLTNLPTMPADWITASGLKADAVAEIQAGLALEATLTAIKGAGWVSTETLHALKGFVDEIETRLTSTRAGYLDKLNITGNVASSTEVAAVQADLDNPDQYKADVSGIPAAVWAYTTRTLSSFGSLVSDIWAHATRTLSAFGFTVATNSDANVTAIKAKTDNLPASPAPAGEYDARLTAIQTDLDNPNQYKADVSALAKTTHVQEVEDKVDAVKLKTDNIPANPAIAGEYTARLIAIQADLDDPAQYQADVSGIPDAILAKVIVDTLTVEQVLKVLAAVETGVTTGGGTDTIVYTGKDGTEIRLTGVDEDGNRSTVIVIPGA